MKILVRLILKLMSKKVWDQSGELAKMDLFLRFLMLSKLQSHYFKDIEPKY